MKICIIGNSHVGSLKRAWQDKRESDNPEHSLTFFAARRRLIKHSVVTDGKLVPTSDELRKSFAFTSDGQEQIDLAAYDVFLVYCLFVKPYQSNGALCTRACLTAAVDDYFTPQLGIQIARSIRASTSAQVFLGHDPLTAAPEGSDAEPPAPSLDPKLDDYIAGLTYANALFFKPQNMTLLEQPKETRVPDQFQTRASFAKGSRRLSIGDHLDNIEHEADDRRHMNEAFGGLYLDRFFQILEKRKTAAKMSKPL